MNRKKATKQNNREQLRQKAWPGVLLLAVLCLLGGLLARYVHQTVTGTGQITAENFYFTADLLGDTTMVPTEGEAEERYSFGDASTEGSWYLYGAGAHEIPIQVQNYYDELRVTEQEISYQAEISVKDAEGNTVTPANGAGPTLTDADGSAFTNGTLPGETQSAQTLTLSIPAYTSWNYTDGTVVTIAISSKKPYRKTLTLRFTLYATDTTLKYQVLDSAGSPYAELVLMTNVDGDVGVQPYLTWSDDLSIDNTNKLTFTYAGGVFRQQDGMAERNMQLSDDLDMGRSESIYFFKDDPTVNYSKETTIVNKTDGKYTIHIGKAE